MTAAAAAPGWRRLYRETDQQRLYVPCRACGAFQLLEFDAAPGPVAIACRACGLRGGPVARLALIAAAVWIRTYDGGADNPAPPACFPAAELPRWRGRGAGGRMAGFALHGRGDTIEREAPR